MYNKNSSVYQIKIEEKATSYVSPNNFYRDRLHTHDVNNA